VHPHYKKITKENSMTLYTTLKKDMIAAMKDGNKEIQSLLKTVVAEVDREKYKDHSDKNVKAIVKRLINELITDFKKYGIDKYKNEANFLSEAYFPKVDQQSKESIIEFLNTVDFSTLKNKMEAIKLILNYFPAGSVEGSRARNIVINYGN
jgi:uncharacterized protein YggL (DUF469 family)